MQDNLMNLKKQMLVSVRASCERYVSLLASKLAGQHQRTQQSHISTSTVQLQLRRRDMLHTGST